MAIKDIQFPAALVGGFWKRNVKVLLGRAIEILLPRYVTRIAGGQMPARLGIVERLVIAALVDKYSRAGTLDRLAPIHAWLWRGEQAVSFHEQVKSRFDSWWLGHHSAIVVPIQQLVDARQSPYSRLCEIGCGAGLILEDLCRRLASLQSFIGLDLSPLQTERNRQRTVDPRIRFEAGDANIWIPAHGRPGTIYLTVAGVFEYFQRSDLEVLFKTVARDQRPAVIAVVEPVASDFDLDNEAASRPYGYENSLAHNYPRLLRDAGFDICFQQLQDLDGQGFLLVVAEIRS